MFTGTGTALVTPFRSDGTLDEPALRMLVKRQIDAGIDFLVPCGTTGESPTLTNGEHLRVVEITLEVAKGRVPVLAGAGGYNTAGSGCDGARNCRHGRERNSFRYTVLQQAHAGRFVPAFQDGIAEAVTIPVILYSVQGRTGVNIEPGTVKKLAAVENIVGIKEASGNMGQMGTILNCCPGRIHRLVGG